MFKQFIRILIPAMLVIVHLVCLFTPASATVFAARYDAEAAATYAAEHWNDGNGVCDEFVKNCLKAGGVEILAGGVGNLKSALVDSGLGEESLLTISSDGVHALESENPQAQPGDILFFYCELCERFIHTAMIGGYDSNGYLYAYAHNPGWDQVNWLGNFTHTTAGAEQHRKCYQYIVVTMDREAYSHPHDFTGGLYENEHPHRMYARCECGIRYYLGWNATVSYCTICNPPVADVPVVSAVAEEGCIALEWTTVADALEYQVWRSRSENGTYFKLYSAMGTRMTNKSVTAGTTYYYKVVAVLEKDSAGNVARSVSSDVVCCAVPEQKPEGPQAPVISGSLNASNKAVISWETSANAVKYEVWRSTSENGTYTKLITTTKLQCTNSPKPNTYYYKVRAIDAEGATSEYSNIVCITVPTGELAAPVISGKLSSGNKAVISWKAVANAAKYEVWRSTSENGTYTKLITTSKLQCTNSPKPNTYYYKVRAIGTDGTLSKYSNTVCVVVPGTADPVPVISGKLNSGNKAVICWNTVANAAKYEVWRSTSENGTYKKLITTTKLQCINAPKPGTYYYKVRAVDTNGTAGVFSNIVCVTVPGEMDSVPVITGTVNANKKAVISWNPVANAVKYEVWRATSKDGTYIKLITTTNLSCINSPAANTYYYKVRAINANGTAGEYSNVLCLTIPR